MTSKLNQRASSILAVIGIAVLLALIIMLWVLVGQGTFRKGGKVHHEDIKTEDELYIMKPDRRTEEHSKEPKGRKEPTDVPKVEDGFETEFVKPLKISPPPLHDHDIIYDQIHGRDVQDRPSIRHHSGHFRHKMAEIWDPHPEYEIQAFGKKIHLVLAHNDKFILPTVQVTHVWSNFTQKVKPDYRTSGCYYTGKVKGDDRSNVAVSLCGGMTGYISSTEGSFYIEPVEKFQNYTVQSILHKIHKIHNGKQLTNSINDNLQKVHDHKCDTDEVSQVLDELPSGEHHIHKRDVFSKRYDQRARRSGNQQYYIETLVVADKKMAEYHKTHENLLHYILVLMAHVSLLFKDATIGNPVTMVVVKISILKDKEFVKQNSKNGVNSSELLRKFCEYQKEMNSRETSNGAVHHDIALLLTRETICRNYTAQQCDTLGLAELGTMCNPHRSCAIIKDKGLPTSYTIAHELGHVLSMPHDDDQKCNRFHGETKMNNIMSRMLQNDTKPWLWSACSKYFLTEFLDSNRAHCLLNRPERDLINNENMLKRLPGETFDEDRQCELVYGKGAKICSFMPRCGSLWCATKGGEEEGCRTMYLPWADGTSCDYGKWCHRGECVALDRGLLQPIDGAWGPWKPWGPCSRHCGGGIRKSERACDSPPPANGGLYCTGRSVRYMSCNTDPCDENVMDFRAEQCAVYNGHTKGLPNLASDVEWIPKYGGPVQEVCKLYCRVSRTNSYYLFAEKVIDGTKCGLDSYNICVNGVCQQGGCDNRLDSNKSLDECGICGGDNSKCKEIVGSYNVSNPYGYNKVLRIPKGSSNIDIRQHGFQGSSKDENYLALVDSETGEYILNGNFMVSTFRKVLIYSGVTIEYSGSHSVVERVNTSRSIQLKKDLIVEVLTVGRLLPPDIMYSYKITSDSVPKYSWQLYGDNWTPCSSICSGTMSLIPACIEIATNIVVASDNCSDLSFDGVKATRPCNRHCMLSWKKKSRSQCSAHCGQGVRQVQLKCARFNIPSDDSSKQNLLDDEADLDAMPWAIPVDDLHCSNIPKPSDIEPCEGPCDKTHWHYNLWSECTKTCGRGVKVRTADCVDSNNKEIDSSACLKAPDTQRICNTQKCPRWTYVDWTPCSVTCGKGFRMKAAQCQDGNEVVSNSYCDHNNLTNPVEDCYMRACTKWTAGNWSHCTASCGKGLHKREVACRSFGGALMEDSHCNGSKPAAIESCIVSKCPEIIPFKPNIINEIDDNSILPTYKNYKYEWRTSNWSECSASCNAGYKTRKVVCKNEAGVEFEERCDQSNRPRDTNLCNEFPCPRWNDGAWSACDSNCFRQRLVICQDHNGATISDGYCPLGDRPLEKDVCSNCGKWKWKTEKWSACSKSCGRGVKTRHVSCVNFATDVTIVDHYCRHERKPKTHKPCSKNDCPYTWLEGEWSQCTVSCGEGLQYRNVTCHKAIQARKLDPHPVRETSHRNYCDRTNKPLVIQKCITRYCNELYSWYPGNWTECSHQCGRRGRRERHISCIYKTGKTVPKKLCAKSLRPTRKEKCNQSKCNVHNCRDVKHKMKAMLDKEYYVTVRGKALKVYCHNMAHVHPLEYISLPNEGRENYAEIYDKRLVNTDSCPNGGKRDETCPDCVEADPDRSGLTLFSKIRINVTSLQVIGNDFTFARQIKGKKVAYGTAGDCYSSLRNCPQGRFSIDLTGTKLRLSSRTNWATTGQTASIIINQQEMTKVSGKCGGYCGHCEPDHRIGLLLEIH